MRCWMFTLLLLATVPCLAAAPVYHWTDAHGVSHFSDAPPPHGVHFTLVDMATGAVSQPPAKQAAASSNAKATNADDAGEASGESKRMADTPANRAKLCKTLAERIKLLSSDLPLTVNADSSEVMTDAMRAQRLSSARAQSQKYCAAP